MLPNGWEHGVRVDAIAPGYMTNVMREAEAVGERDDTDVKHQIEALTPRLRTGSDDEFAGPAVFLASDASGFIYRCRATGRRRVYGTLMVVL